MSFLLLVPALARAQDDYIHPELAWQTIETPHFFIDYHQGEERTAKLVAKIAEEMYGPVTSLYHHEPTQKVSFVIWNTDDYSNGETYFFDNKINIWASNLDFALRGTHNWLRNVITHEFTHDVQMQTAMKFGRRVPAIYLQWLGYEAERRPDVLYGYPNVVVSYPLSGIVVPAWFAEGVAQYNIPDLNFQHDTWDSHRDMTLRMYVLNDRMLTLEEMGGFGKTSLGNESTYNAGFAFVHYLAGKYGPEILRKLSDAMTSASAVSIDHAFRDVLGKSGNEIYREWQDYLKVNYEKGVADIKENLHEGKIIAGTGFANFYPVYSPDGRYIAYCSNKESDYFGTSSLYLYNVADSSEKQLADFVSGELSWSPDGKYLVYTKENRYNEHWDDLYDIYSYDIASSKETRLTHGLRSQYSSLSPDGKHIAFVGSSDAALNMLCEALQLTTGELVGGTDGTMNLYSADIDLTTNRVSNIKRLTNFISGQQIYQTRWSHDESKIVFDYSINSSRRIGICSLSDNAIQFVTPRDEDSRDASFIDNDSCIVFSSDRSGIFNLYQQNLFTDSVAALTNVLGGAFMPSVSRSGSVVFSSYQWSGYKIAQINAAAPVPLPASYHMQIDPPFTGDPSDQVAQVPLKKYDDTSIPDYQSRPYVSTTTSMSFYPVLLFDNYNPHTSFFDEIKAGIYFNSTDVVGKYDIFGGATINKLLERDLFLQLNYNDDIPGLSALGVFPQFTLSAYNISRQAHGIVPLAIDTVDVPVTYDLIEVDAAFGGPIIAPTLRLSVGFTFDMYSSTISGFTLPETGQYTPSIGYAYFLGRTLYSQIDFDGIAPARNSWINPLGLKTRFRLSAAIDKLSNGNFDTNTNLIVPLYNSFRFFQAELMNYFALPLLRDDDGLAVKLHVGYTFGPRIDNFFDFYAGGLVGMRGYPFYALGGNKLLTINGTYRYPLFRDVDKQILQFYLSDIYLSVYGDVGNCWDGDPFGTRFKKDVGSELRMNGFSFYSFPTAIFFDATYGLDRFTTQLQSYSTSVTYGKEWRFYFGLTFSFDIVDFGRQL